MMKERVWLLRTTAARLVDRAAMLGTAGSACALGCVVALNEMRRFPDYLSGRFLSTRAAEVGAAPAVAADAGGALEAYLDSVLKGGTETSGVSRTRRMSDLQRCAAAFAEMRHNEPLNATIPGPGSSLNDRSTDFRRRRRNEDSRSQFPGRHLPERNTGGHS